MTKVVAVKIVVQLQPEIKVTLINYGKKKSHQLKLFDEMEIKKK
jgi:hypothetical protein